MPDDPQASLIGVAIACAGNILISLALTVQKLAHKRGAEKAAAAQAVEAASKFGRLSLHGPPHIDQLVLNDDYVDPLTPTTRPLPASRLPGSDRNGGRTDIPLSSSSGTDTPPLASEGTYLTSRLWWFGLGLMAVGEAGNFLSYGFAPASVVAPLGTVALIANCVFAPLVLGESFTMRNVMGMLLAILGAVTVVWSSRDSNKRMSPDELWAAITAPLFIIYTAVNIAVIVPLTLLSSRDSWGGKYIGIDVGVCALFGGYTVMATKALSSLVSTKFLAALRYPIAWAAIVVLVATSVFQIKFLNRALMRFESKEVIPTQFVFFSLSAIIGSAVLYNEFQDVGFSHFVNFTFGIATTFLGVYFLTTPGNVATEAPSRTSLEVVDEETPLLTPPRRPSLVPNLPIGIGAAPALPPAHVGRLIKRTSSTNLAVGINSQGSLLLLATTPPVTPSAPGGHSHGHTRDRSMSLGRAFSGLTRCIF
ncbi:uncharacterized protein EHS24_002117 [Apiotrichum porosum]|uniref:NIPA-like protein 3 n=1 Tax=Apiotrichum porosum TaxID=105984 RepID=A0A427XHS9_9TREE|nr:uncharacterized protein EHS24_002117 [Apiotrichum porosum]RSH78392.1 hypothetical protein EHS24_002117 [Apiotrichum porosum]